VLACALSRAIASSASVTSAAVAASRRHGLWSSGSGTYAV
jgi:hypothetical protein